MVAGSVTGSVTEQSATGNLSHVTDRVTVSSDVADRVTVSQPATSNVAMSSHAANEATFSPDSENESISIVETHEGSYTKKNRSKF